MQRWECFCGRNSWADRARKWCVCDNSSKIGTRSCSARIFTLHQRDVPIWVELRSCGRSTPQSLLFCGHSKSIGRWKQNYIFGPTFGARCGSWPTSHLLDQIIVQDRCGERRSLGFSANTLLPISLLRNSHCQHTNDLSQFSLGLLHGKLERIWGVLEGHAES